MSDPTQTTRLPPVRSYELTVQGFPPSVYHERTPARARAKAWEDYNSVFDSTFRHFLSISSIRRIASPAGIGERIMVAGRPAVRAGTGGQYVRFMRDDSDVALLSHPADVSPYQEQGA